MAIKLVEVKNDGTSGVVILESDNSEYSKAIMELQGGGARELAIKEAAKNGIPDPRCNGLSFSAYPVDEKGNQLDDPRATIGGYRIDVPVTSKIV